MANINRYTERYCPICGSVKDKSQFQSSPNPKHNEGKLPYCKACCTAMLKEYIQQTGSESAGLWCLLMELGLPFMSTIWENVEGVQEVAAERGGRKPDVFATYLKLLKERDIKIEGLWQTDVMLDELIEIEKLVSAEEKPEMDLREQERIWGRFEPEDYEFLNDMFDAYTSELPNMDMALIMRYRDLCKAELAKRKADEEGDVSTIQKAQKNLVDTLTLLKLNDFQNNRQSDIEKFIERKAWQIENTRPAECEDLNKYKDYSGFEKTWEHIMRCCRNLVASTKEYPKLPPEAKIGGDD